MDLKSAVILVLLLQFRNVLSSTLEEGSPCVLKDGTEGICLRLSDCDHANEDLKKFVLPKFCKFNLWKPLVCCDNCRFIQNRFFDGISIKVSFALELEVKFDDSGKVNHEKREFKRQSRECLEKFLEHFPCNKYEQFKDLDDSVTCYDSPHNTENVVTRGHDAKRNEYPHLALIGCGDYPHHAYWICSGAIISDKYILSAAHCTSNRVLGEIKFAAMGIQMDYHRNWQIYDVVKIIVHPDYKPPSTYHDIALLETRAKIRYNHEVIPACLHRGEDMAEVATATGWGAMGHRLSLEDILKGVDIHKFSDEKCMKAYTKHRNLVNGYNSTTQLCYGDEEQINDTCQGDSGGPLQIKTNEKKSKCLYTIVGITSYGRACGHFGSSGLYTRVEHYVPWIKSITGE